MFVLGSAYLDPDKQLLTIGAGSVTLQRKPYQRHLQSPFVLGRRKSNRLPGLSRYPNPT